MSVLHLAVVSASSNDTREALTSLVDSVPPDVLIGLKHLRGPQLAALIPAPGERCQNLPPHEK